MMKRLLLLPCISICLWAASPDVEAFLKAELQKRGAKFSELHVGPVAAALQGEMELAGIEYDPVHGKTYFRIRTTGAHKQSFEVGVSGEVLFPVLVAKRDILPGLGTTSADFVIDYRPPSSLAAVTVEDLTGRKSRRKIAAGEVLRPEMFEAMTLVEPGRMATMTVEGPGFVLSRQVAPLEAGGLGQTIRVRAPETNIVLKAVVVDRDKLKGED